MKILDIGCGRNKRKDAIGIDIVKLEGVDVVCNLEEGLPFKDSVFDLVYASHVLEHVHNFIQLMEEIWRVLKPNGKLIIDVPFFAHEHAYGNPTHIRFFTWNSFHYFTSENPENYISKARFKILKRKIIWSTSPKLYMRILNKFFTFIVNLFPRIYSYYFCYILPCESLHVEMEAIK